MCMLCVIPPKVMPSKDKLENSALNNPHGFGWAIAVPSEQRIISERTMNADESINSFLTARAQYMDGYAIWHARYATHGAKIVDNCHPFIVGNDKRTYLAHNGILDIDIPKLDERSDTRIFAEELLPAVGGVTALDNDWVWSMFEDYTSGSKIAVLTVDPAAKHSMYLINGQAGSEDESGVWWSNDSCYLDSWASAKPKSSAYAYSDKDYDFYAKSGKELAISKNSQDSEEEIDIYVCHNCNGYFDENELEEFEDTCPQCGFCFDCLSEYLECNCWKSAGTSTPKTHSGGWGGW